VTMVPPMGAAELNVTVPLMLRVKPTVALDSAIEIAGMPTFTVAEPGRNWGAVAVIVDDPLPTAVT